MPPFKSFICAFRKRMLISYTFGQCLQVKIVTAEVIRFQSDPFCQCFRQQSVTHLRPEIHIQAGIYIYNMIQYLCISLPSFKTSFSNTPPLLIIDLAEPMLSLSQTNKTLSIPSFLHSSKAKLIILVA